MSNPLYNYEYVDLNPVIRPSYNKRYNRDDFKSPLYIMKKNLEDSMKHDSLYGVAEFRAIALWQYPVADGTISEGWLSNVWQSIIGADKTKIFIVHARIPEIHKHLPIPKGADDKATIGLYPKFIGRSDVELGYGDIINVTFDSLSSFSQPRFIDLVQSNEQYHVYGKKADDVMAPTPMSSLDAAKLADSSYINAQSGGKHITFEKPPDSNDTNKWPLGFPIEKVPKLRIYRDFTGYLGDETDFSQLASRVIKLKGDEIVRNEDFYKEFITEIQIPGIGTLECHKYIAPYFLYFFAILDKHGLINRSGPNNLIRRVSIYSPRSVTKSVGGSSGDPKKPSLHAFGVAMDLNGKNFCLVNNTKRMSEETVYNYWNSDYLDERIVQLAKDFGFRWLGNSDAMHFDCMLASFDSDIAQAKKEIKEGRAKHFNSSLVDIKTRQVIKAKG